MTYDDITKNFKAYRINYSLTQKELAAKSGVSERSITRFENGGDINLSNFVKLIMALDLEDNLRELIPDQSRRPSSFLKDAPKKQRASAKRRAGNKNVEKKSKFVWGDEKE